MSPTNPVKKEDVEVTVDSESNAELQQTETQETQEAQETEEEAQEQDEESQEAPCTGDDA